MKRNWDTIREILLKTEEQKIGSDLSLNDFDSDRIDEISYHVKLLEESGLIKASTITGVRYKLNVALQ